MGNMRTVERDAHGHPLPGQVLNPKGKGGFVDHPENASHNGFNPRASYVYNLNQYKAMTDNELAEVSKHIDELTQAEQTALRMVLSSKKVDELGFRKYQDIADRTEGKARQTIDTTVAQVEPPKVDIDFS